jgi:hypothetical protein
MDVSFDAFVATAYMYHNHNAPLFRAAFVSQWQCAL